MRQENIILEKINEIIENEFAEMDDIVKIIYKRLPNDSYITQLDIRNSNLKSRLKDRFKEILLDWAETLIQEMRDAKF
jgi:hypothetical protein